MTSTHDAHRIGIWGFFSLIYNNLCNWAVVL